MASGRLGRRSGCRGSRGGGGGEASRDSPNKSSLCLGPGSRLPAAAGTHAGKPHGCRDGTWHSWVLRRSGTCLLATVGSAAARGQSLLVPSTRCSGLGSWYLPDPGVLPPISGPCLQSQGPAGPTFHQESWVPNPRPDLGGGRCSVHLLFGSPLPVDCHLNFSTVLPAPPAGTCPGTLAD